MTTKPGGDDRTSPPDSSALVGPHKEWAAGWAAQPPDRGLAVWAYSKSSVVLGVHDSNR